MTPRLEDLLPIALEAVAIGSDLVRSHAPGVLTTKGDRDMATEVDYAVERAVRAHLRAKVPMIPVLGEEEGISGDEHDGLLWALDPVDGTVNFVHGLPLCAVSLGLVDKGRSVLGVIDLPFLESTYSAVHGGGAHLGDRPLRASATAKLSDAIVALGDYAVGEDAEAKNRVRMGITQRLAADVQRVRMFGSAAVDLAWVAEGRIDACISLSNKPWDTAAGVIIAREAGAVVIDKDGSDHTFDSTATVSVAPRLVDDVKSLLQETCG